MKVKAARLPVKATQARTLPGLMKNPHQKKPILQRTLLNPIRFPHNTGLIPVYAPDTLVIHPKHITNNTGDSHEQEADQAAGRVLSMPDSQLEDHPGKKLKPAPALLQSRINSITGSGGDPLPAGPRGYF